jgi:multiple sugar transport system ATP-binding protein
MRNLGLDQDAVLVGVRPHDLSLAARGDADAVGRVEVVEPLGATTILHLRIDRASERPIRVVVPSELATAVDAEVAVCVRRDHVYLFNERTGAALMRS